MRNLLLAAARASGKLDRLMQLIEFRRLIGAARCADAWRRLGASIDQTAQVSPGTSIRKPRNVTIGPGCRLAGHVLLDAWAPITLESNVLVNSAKFYTGGHDIESPTMAGLSNPIFVSDHVWIINDVIVLPGVTIRPNAVIATGSVVTRDVDANAVVGGNPARFIKDRKTAPDFVPSGPGWG